jgi:hypothetical protein
MSQMAAGGLFTVGGHSFFVLETVAPRWTTSKESTLNDVICLARR